MRRKHEIGHRKKIKKVKAARYRALGPELILMYRQSARRSIRHPPGGRLPLLSDMPAVTSQPQSITGPWPLPSYTA